MSKPCTTWTPSWDGATPHYAATRGGLSLELRKRGRTWMLVLSDGREFDLGRKATFDHAERVLRALALD